MTARDSTLSCAPPRAVSGASLGLAPDEGPPDDWGEDDTVAGSRRYVEAGVLGRGGMGEIRIGYDHRLAREVAIKTPLLDHPAARAQFVSEARVTAKLDHPGIVAVHDAGYLPDGRPYYTMPILAGRTLADAIASAGARERIALVRHVLDACEAVAYAHSVGVVHRDLKPSNILVGRFGETVVLDWGLAGPSGCAAPGRVGTPRYMPPEQAERSALDPRSDVYALGATLREVVTGSPVHDSASAVPPELRAIIDRATREDRHERYADARALADDLIAWFEGRRVAAHEYGLFELAARVWTAHRVPVVATLLVVATIAIATAIAYRRTRDERARAQHSEAEAIAAYERAETSLAQAEVAQAIVAMDRNAWSEAELYAAAALTHGPSPKARGVLARFDEAARPALVQRVEPPGCTHTAISPDGHTIACTTAQGVVVAKLDTEWIELGRDRASGDVVAVTDDGRSVLVRGLDGAVTAIDPIGGRPALPLAQPAGNPKRFRVHDRRAMWVSGVVEYWADLDRRELRSSRTCLDEGAPNALAQLDVHTRIVVCQNGRVLAGRGDGVITRLGEIPAATGAPLVVASDPSTPELAAIATTRGHVVLLDLTSGVITREFAAARGTASDLALSHGRLAVVHTGDGVDVWDLATGDMVVRLAIDARHVRWIDGGARLRTVGSTVSDFALGPSPWRPHRQHHGSGIAALTIAGDTVISAHGDGQIRVTPATASEAAMVLPLHWSVVKDVEASPDGTQVVAISAQGDELYIVDPADPLAMRTLPARAGARVSWLAGDLIVAAPYIGGFMAWRAGVRVDDLEPHESPRILDMESDADRQALTAVEDGGRIVRVFADDPTPRMAAHRPGASAVAGNADVIAVLGDDWLEILGADGEGRRRALDGIAVDVQLSRDGRFAAVTHADGSASVWGVADLQPLAVLLGHAGYLPAVSFADHDAALLTAGWDGDVRRWSLRTLERPADELLPAIEHVWGRSIDDVLRETSGLHGPSTVRAGAL